MDLTKILSKFRFNIFMHMKFVKQILIGNCFIKHYYYLYCLLINNHRKYIICIIIINYIVLHYYLTCTCTLNDKIYTPVY